MGDFEFGDASEEERERRIGSDATRGAGAAALLAADREAIGRTTEARTAMAGDMVVERRSVAEEAEEREFRREPYVRNVIQSIDQTTTFSFSKKKTEKQKR